MTGYAGPMFLLLLLACPKTLPPPSVGSPVPVSAPALPTVAADFAPLEEQISGMLASADQGDQLDRLVVLQELLLKTRGMDPAAQRALFVYADQLLKIEQRNLPMPIADASPDALITAVEPQGVAVSAADQAAWLDAELQKATDLLVSATHLEGAARRAPLEKARDILDAAVRRYPDSPKAAELQKQLEQVKQDLAAVEP